MTTYYLDSSAWLKRYVREAGSRWIGKLFDGGPRLACSTLGAIEVIATLARRQRAGDLTARAFDRAAGETEADFERFIQIDLAGDVLGIARSLPRIYALRASDTVHLASAMSLRQVAEERQEILVFVTSDAELGTAATLARFPVVAPEDSKPA